MQLILIKKSQPDTFKLVQAYRLLWPRFKNYDFFSFPSILWSFWTINFYQLHTDKICYCKYKYLQNTYCLSSLQYLEGEESWPRWTWILPEIICCNRINSREKSAVLFICCEHTGSLPGYVMAQILISGSQACKGNNVLSGHPELGHCSTHNPHLNITPFIAMVPSLQWWVSGSRQLHLLT